MPLFPKTGNDGTRCTSHSNVCLSKRGNYLTRSYRWYEQVSLHGMSWNEGNNRGILPVLDSRRNANGSSVIFLHTIGLFDNLSISFPSCFLSLVYKFDEDVAGSQNCLARRRGWFLFCVWYTHSIHTRINICDTTLPLQYFISVYIDC
jgi:hypothetical protein